MDIRQGIYVLVACCVLAFGIAGCSGGGGGGGGGDFKSLEVSPAAPSIASGTSQQFKATALFSDGGTQDVTALVSWSSSNTAVATISNVGASVGAAQALSQGTTTITASYPGGSASASLTVTAAAITALAVTPANPSVANGTKQQFKATATFSDKSTQDVTSTATWSSSSPGVATISNATGSVGLAQALGAGSTTIGASYSGQSASTNLTVTTATVASIAVTPATPSIAKGTRQQFTATATLSDNTVQDVTQSANWTSSNTNVASISTVKGSNGSAQGLLAGTTTIAASFGGQSGSTLLTVTAAVATALAVTPTNPSIANGTTEQFKATATFSDGTSQDVTQSATWVSSNTAAASISNTTGSVGFATSTGIGTSTISASFSNQTGSSTLTVTGALVTAISVTPANVSIAKGSTQQYVATATFNDGTTQDVTTSATWGSSNPAVASISSAQGSDGLASALSTGSATISANYGGAAGAAALQVTAATLVAIEVSPANSRLPVGFSRTLRATGIYSDSTRRDVSAAVSWQAGDSAVVTISNTSGPGAQATGVAAGTVAITAQLGAVSGGAALAVTAASLTAVQVTPFGASLPLGSTQPFTATGLFSDNTTLDLTAAVLWQSSNTAAAAISNAAGSKGLATGIVQAGPLSISAQYAGVTGAAALTVTAATLRSIALSTGDSTASVPSGETVLFTATGTYSDGTSRDLTNLAAWQTSNALVAPVSNAAGSRGLATAAAQGSASISATAGGIFSNSVAVNVGTATLRSLAIGPSGPAAPVGVTQQFNATATFSDGSQRDVTREAAWQSSDVTVAGIDNLLSPGLASTFKTGAATVSAAYGNVTPASTTLTVSGATLNSIGVTPATPAILAGAAQQFSALGSYSDGTSRDLTAVVTWTSNASGTADVGNSAGAAGLAYGKAAGTAMIIATDPLSAVAGTTQLTVNAP